MQIRLLILIVHFLLVSITWKIFSVLFLLSIKQHIISMSLVNVNKLTKIPIDKLAQLRDLYKADSPKHVIAYSTLQGFNERLKNCTEDENKVQILCLNNDWESDGTFIILVREP